MKLWKRLESCKKISGFVSGCFNRVVLILKGFFFFPIFPPIEEQSWPITLGHFIKSYPNMHYEVLV